MPQSRPNPAPSLAGPYEDLTIRSAVKDNLDAITRIYNQAVVHTTATFDTAPRSLADQTAWFDEHGESYPILVAAVENNVVGWAALSPWSDRCAYETTVEVSIYVDEASQSRGIGTRLLAALLVAGRTADLHLALARIAEENTGSIRLHERAGFVRTGIMHEAGYKFGRYLDVVIMELLLDGSRK